MRSKKYIWILCIALAVMVAILCMNAVIQKNIKKRAGLPVDSPKSSQIVEISENLPQNDDFKEGGSELLGKEEKTENGPNLTQEEQEGENDSSGERIFTQNGLEVVHFIRAKDGDTLFVTLGDASEQTIRLIGVNAPESVATEAYTEKTGKENNDYGKAASDYTKALLKDVDVLYLEYDEEKTDSYGRLLAYVYLSDTGEEEQMLNAILVKDGYASVMTIEPNTKYKDLFSSLQEEAIKERRGLWEYDEYREHYESY